MYQFVTAKACNECGFSLWLPIVSFEDTQLGLYSDRRFPGRCILTLGEHFSQLDQVPGDTRNTFMNDIARATTALKAATGSKRINVAILGNAESHVHAHLIPRLPHLEPAPNKAPWEDTRAKGPLDSAEQEKLILRIREECARERPLSTLPLVRSSNRLPQATTLFDSVGELGLPY